VVDDRTSDRRSLVLSQSSRAPQPLLHQAL